LVQKEELGFLRIWVIWAIFGKGFLKKGRTYFPKLFLGKKGKEGVISPGNFFKLFPKVYSGRVWPGLKGGFRNYSLTSTFTFN